MADNITQLLRDWGAGDQRALDQLMPLVYDELRRLARRHLRHELHQHSLQPTMLVHEAYLRLADQPQVSWENRAQFFGLAAKLMRNILVDHVRARQADKRGGGALQVSLSAVDQLGRVAQEPEVELLALDAALERLAAYSPQHSRLVELRFFGGLTIPETAEVMGLSHATVERNWTFARAWLRNELSR
ncbi:MAG: sigma-70 family RNA polymerase sigma factor [Acidobacteria bacterium]|nr:sigma-70 family RNA polymerase sigma factor [Acidobacteriota bacterium]MBI3424279.1 sigma-70 family RNA polymerase sigma factor [Acidobacteriota bacterium]